jgi:hypothetical protein
MVLFDRTIGPNARLVATRVAVPSRVARGAHLKVWAVRTTGGRLRVLLIDKGAHPISVDLRIRATGSATVERLLAPSVRSRSGVTLAGQHLGRDGRWHGVRQTKTIRPSPSGYVVTVPRMSAALVGMRLPPPSANQ